MEAVGVVAGVAGVASLAKWITAPWLNITKNTPQQMHDITKDPIRGLKVEHDPGAAEIDICFVHGLNGDAKSTWTAQEEGENGQGIFWPTQLLSDPDAIDEKSFPQARIMLYGYDTDVNSLCWLTERTLYHHAKHFLRLLTKERTQCKHRPLLFVAHSLGGLLVKSALIFARDVVSTSITDEREIFLSTFGVVSFGTPQTFAGKVSLCDAVDRLCQIQASSAHAPYFEDYDTETWKADVQILQRRLDRYKPIAKEIPEVFCYESRGENGSHTPVTTRMTLPPKHFVHGLCEAISIEADHANMCKFATYNREYRKIRKTIRKLYQQSTPLLSKRRDQLIGSNHTTTAPGRTIRDLGFLVDFELPRRRRFVSRANEYSRQDYLDMLDKRLVHDRSAILTGPLGHGKTTLALEYAHRQKDRREQRLECRYTSVFWLHAASELSLEVSFVKMIHQLRSYYNKGSTRETGDETHSQVIHALDSIKVTEDDVPLREEDRRFSIRAVMDWLCFPENKSWLLIYDDIEHVDAPYLQDFLPPTETQRGYIIMTSREDHTRDFESKENDIRLGPFKRTQSGLSSNEDDLVQPSLGVICRTTIHNLPEAQVSSHSGPNFLSPSPTILSAATRAVKVQRFASIRVGSFTRAESVDLIETFYDDAKTPPESSRLARRKTFDQLADELDDVPSNIAYVGGQFESSDDPVQSARPEILMSDLEELQAEPQDFSHWLNASVMLDRDPIPRQLIQAGFHVDEATALFGLEQLRAAKWAWISQDKETFNIPDDRRRYRRQQLGASDEAISSARLACMSIIETLKRLDTEANPLFERTACERMLLKHVNACLEICKNWRVLVDCEWDILAELCEKHSLFEEASTFYRAAGGQHIPNSDTYSQLSTSIMDAAPEGTESEDGWDDNASIKSTDRPLPETSKAGFSHSTAITMETKTSRTLRSELGLIRMQVKQGQFEDLDNRCQKIFKQIETRHEERYLRLKIEVLKQMVAVKVAQQDWSRAIHISYEVIEQLERDLGPSAYDTVEAVHELAKIHIGQGDYSGAEPLLEQILMTRQQIFGNSHPRTIAVSEDLARAYREQGRLKNALETYLQILKIYRELLGEEHIQTAKVKENLAIIRDMMGNHAAADDLYDSAVHAARLLGTESEEYQGMLKRYQARQEGTAEW